MIFRLGLDNLIRFNIFTILLLKNSLIAIGGVSTVEYHFEVDVFKKSNGSFQKALVKAVDGACPHNGKSSATKSSFGVFFGPESPLNTYDVITRPPGEKYTNSYAELRSAFHALQLVKHNIKLRDWRKKHMVRRLPVIMMTDSKYVLDCLTKWIEGWLQNRFKTFERKPITNTDLILRIHQLIELLSNDDIDVRLWSVPREQNRGADALANRSLQASLPIEQNSPSLRYFRGCMRSCDLRVMNLANDVGILSPDRNHMEMHLGVIIMYMVMLEKIAERISGSLSGRIAAAIIIR
ncbi:hypothetical protein SBOR_8617 [Sclerotinia borealis F-4128]|uniref:ribonuclease H n=1 Tax=Sclerotinia borealis (strain F-4128) TaxID=1432307 RepID=W9C5H8_SCLBF|nr:hypothetical protein SBOR_8617 [Sclerotinia borealis F-4128]